MILTQIQEWNETICKSSRYKKDLGFIRDMHRLLSYKGYIFPEVNKSDLAVLNPSDNLKSLEDIQKEERLAQSAKLQELIRRGRPEDLAEANKLMKVMSGFQEDKKLNEVSRQKLAEDISKIKGKVEVFADMVNNYNENDASASSHETLEELYTSLKVSQPTLAKIVSEEQHDESADPEFQSQLLALNDTINLLIQKYSLIKQKDVVGASKINVSAAGEINLIDFDGGDGDDTAPVAAAAVSENPPPPTPAKDSLLDLLGGLDLSSSSPSPAPVAQNITSPSQTSQTSAFEALTQLQNLDKVSSAPLNQGSLSQQSTAAQTHDLFQSNQSLFSGFDSAPAPAAASTVVVNTSSYIKLSYVITSKSVSELSLQFYFSNMSLKNVSNVTFLLACPKSLGLKLELAPQSNSFMMAMSTNAISQVAKVTGTIPEVLRMKWKINYKVDSENLEESGVCTVS